MEYQDLIMEQLDRAYASLAWIDNFPCTIIRNFPITISDHAPFRLQTNLPPASKFRPYQIEAWCLHQGIGVLCQHKDLIKKVHFLISIGSKELTILTPALENCILLCYSDVFDSGNTKIKFICCETTKAIGWSIINKKSNN